MKRHSSQLGIWLLVATALIAGCNKKKQPKVAPQAKAPTVSVPQPATQPATITQPPATTAPANQTATTTPSVSKPKAKPKTNHNHAKKTTPATNPPTSKEVNATPAPAVLAAPPATTTATPAPNTPDKPEKTVVHDGGTSESPGAILPGMDQNEANRQRQATEHLLQSTDDALKGINRTLTVDEQSMVAQIRNYMTQSRAATTDGDLLRANNLAVKAHLLTDELIKR